MPPFPHYQSKVLSALMRRVGSLRDRTQTLIRRAQLLGKWSLEAALYPLYHWEQVRKTIGQQICQSTITAIHTLLGADAAPPKTLSASTPIEKVLASIRPTPSSDGRLPQQIGEGLVTTPCKTPQTWIGKGLKKLLQLRHRLIPSPFLRLRKTHQMTQGVKNAQIQGIATHLSHRHLVLVTLNQEILDILTPRQQIILQLKIRWAIHQSALQCRLHHARQRFAQGLSRFSHQRILGPVARLLATTTPLAHALSLPQSRPQKPLRLAHWVLRGIVGAIASLPFVAIPAIAAESIPQPTTRRAFEAQWIDPNHLKPQLSWDELQGMSFRQTQSHGWLADAHESVLGHVARPHQDSASPERSFYTSEYGIEIPIEAEFLGYDPHLLEQILGWLDIVLVQIEAIAASIWQWIGVVVLVSMAVIERIRQRIAS